MKKHDAIEYTPRSLVNFSSVEGMLEYLESLEGIAPLPGSNVTILLPKATEALKLLGLPDSLPSIFHQISMRNRMSLPFRRSTLFKLPKFLAGKISFSKATKRKFLNFLWQSFPRNSENTFSVSMCFTGGVGDMWHGLILGAKHHHRNAAELTYAYEFIEHRIELEHLLLTNMLNDKLDSMERKQLYIKILQQHTLLPREVISLIPSLAADKTTTLTPFEKGDLICSAKLDFYFALIACLEVGLLENLDIKFRGEVLGKQNHAHEGLFQRFIKRIEFRESNEIRIATPFSIYLDWLEEIGTAADNTNISSGKLASFIPLDHSEDTSGGYSKFEKQKDLLKDWKDSKYPSVQKFCLFVQNLRSEEAREAIFLTQTGLAAMVLDKLFLELFYVLKAESSIESYQALDKCMRRYSDYFIYYRETFNVQ